MHGALNPTTEAEQHHQYSEEPISESRRGCRALTWVCSYASCAAFPSATARLLRDRSGASSTNSTLACALVLREGMEPLVHEVVMDAQAVADGEALQVDALALRLVLVRAPDVVPDHRYVVPAVGFARHEKVAVLEFRPCCAAHG